MKEKVRVSFDVPAEEHIFLKSACVNSRITFKDLMQKVFHETVEAFKKEELKARIVKGINESKEGNERYISQDELDNWMKMVDNEGV